MNQASLDLFRALTELPGAPGYEATIRSFVREKIEPVVDEIITDRLGSIFGVKRGDSGNPKIMVAGHMDEVGFMVTGITPNGMLKFATLGGWRSQVLPSARVQVVTSDGVLNGVIGMPSIEPAEHEKAIGIERMFIDIGALDADHAKEMGIRPGQQAVPVCPFTPLADGKIIMAKAWDNRYGVGLAIELLQALKDERLPNTLFAGATVQEEVGMRGAQTAAQLIQPDIAYVLDASPANDIDGNPMSFGRLGGGTLLRILDAGMITHRGLVEFVTDIADSYGIKYQYYVGKGATDASRTHLHGIGVPSAVIGICTRYPHTSSSLIHTDDYAQAKELLLQLVRHTNQSALETILR
ncbi:M42 family metallopeptidase [Paenibacillus sp. strain BS8-2]